MSSIFVQDGRKIEWTNSTGAAVEAGDEVNTGDCVWIAETDIANGASGTLITEGVFRMPAEGDTAWVPGDRLYWDPYLLECTKTASSYDSVGVAAEAKLAAAKTGLVKLVAGAQ